MLSSIVKANAYGHGFSQFVKLAEACGINHFSTASAYEAEQVLQHCSLQSEIMIMGILYDEDLAWAIQHEIEFFIFNHERLPKVLAAAQAVGKKAKVHLEVETGTNRTGLSMPYFQHSIKFLQAHPENLSFQGLCTHLAGAETLSNRDRIEAQIKRYETFYKYAQQQNHLPKYRHIASSAASLAYPEARLDLVRIGIVQYGFWPSPDIYQHHLHETGKSYDNPLKRVITWTTEIMDLKLIKQGDFIGYGKSFRADDDILIAVLPIGYSNGYTRDLSNKGHVLIHGRQCPVVGLVNMNMTMVDVSHVEGVAIDDEVILIGRQGNNEISVASFADSTNQLNNEMLARLPAAIPREIVD